MIKDKIIQIRGYLKMLPKNQLIAEDLDYTTFLATLIPIPGYQQAALLVNKLAANHNLNLLITELRSSIYQINNRIETIENDVEKIQLMATTVSTVSALEEKFEQIREQAIQELSEFIVETEDWSTQTILNQIITADFTSVSANNNSHNVLENVEINSKRTHLRATDHSSNYLQGTYFKGSSRGGVGMNGITQQGDIQVWDNGVAFGRGGALIFNNQNNVEGKCPICGTVIKTTRTELQKKSHVQCPGCKTEHAVNFR